ncbi:MAG: class I SAM-dependent methyltransferase [Planctomycetota bacterium]|nr:class I SAM-dependent methyltransferase [Planctomycetota bacterium]
MKSTVDEIRQRFDNDVERFSSLQTGQSATMDAPLVLDLITSVAARVSPHATRLLDVGCGAGNYTLKMLEKLPNLDITLIDLSQPMLDRAHERISAKTSGKVTTIQGDIRQIDLGVGTFDIVLAAAVLHHLRADEEWQAVFTKLHRCLAPGGSVWISDMVEHSIPAIESEMIARYGEYLATLKDDAYRDAVFAYIKKEDTPRPLLFQIELLRQAGFQNVEILHKTSVFAAFGAVK